MPIRALVLTGALALACGAQAADWRPLASPPQYQSTVDLDLVRSQRGLVQFMVRRVYAQPEADASGRKVYSARLTFIGDYAPGTAAQVFAARSMSLTCTIQEGHVWLASAASTIELAPMRRNS